MGKTYKALKERFDYGTLVGGAFANVFAKLAESEADGKKFKEIEDILNLLWYSIPTRIKRHSYKERGKPYWKAWNEIVGRWDAKGENIVRDVDTMKRRVQEKAQILTDLFFNEDIWIRTKIVDIWDKDDYEIYEEEVEE